MSVPANGSPRSPAGGPPGAARLAALRAACLYRAGRFGELFARTKVIAPNADADPLNLLIVVPSPTGWELEAVSTEVTDLLGRLKEDLLNERRDMLGKDRVYLTRFGRPLRECIGPAQDTLFDQSPDIDTCDEGVCFV